MFRHTVFFFIFNTIINFRPLYVMMLISDDFYTKDEVKELIQALEQRIVELESIANE